jgi:hypothetical protein
MIIRIPLKKIKIPGGGLHLTCHIYADNLQAAVIIDTGASISVFHEKTFSPYFTEGKMDKNEDAFSSGISTMIEGHRLGYISGIALEALFLHNETAGLMDLSHIRKIYNEYFDFAIEGLIGCDMLDKYKAVIDFKRMNLIFHKH